MWPPPAATDLAAIPQLLNVSKRGHLFKLFDSVGTSNDANQCGHVVLGQLPARVSLPEPAWWSTISEAILPETSPTSKVMTTIPSSISGDGLSIGP